MTLIGNSLQFRIKVKSNGELTLSGDVLSPNTGQIGLVFGNVFNDPSGVGLQQFGDGRWGLRIQVESCKRRTFSKTLSLRKMAGRELPVTVEPASGLELANIRFDQWVVDRSVFVHGGCVSRDAFESPDAPPLAGYRARSSFVSAFDQAEVGIPHSDLEANPSAFQRRMLKTELDRELPSLLKAGRFDFMLVDLIVERTALGRTESGGIVTKSPEFIKTGLSSFITQELDNRSDSYFEAFRDAWKQLVETVGESRLLVNRVYWASQQLDGNMVPKASSVAFHNKRLERLYGIVSEVSPSISWINYSSGLLKADEEHKWGPAPYHFGQEFYAAQRAAVRAVVSGQAGKRQLDARSWANEGAMSLTTPMRLPQTVDMKGFVVRLLLVADDRVGKRNALVSFDLQDENGAPLSGDRSVEGLGFSKKVGVGWFSYVSTRQGLNAWIKTVKLPEGITCKGATLHLWGNRKSKVNVLQASVLPA